jgi:hypothetical protein
MTISSSTAASSPTTNPCPNEPPWLSLGIAYTVIAGSALTDANIIENEACLDFKCPNAWFLLPPWPDDDGKEGA